MNKINGPQARDGKLHYQVTLASGEVVEVVRDCFKSLKYDGDPNDHKSLIAASEENTRARFKFYAELKKELGAMKAPAAVVLRWSETASSPEVSGSWSDLKQKK